jgi:two-component system, OmpR family, response regulator
MRILLVEDNPKLAAIVSDILRANGFAADHAACLEEASVAITTAVFDAILLDRCLPDGDGLIWLRGERRKGCTVPTIIMSGNHLDTNAKVDGLNGGADDYLGKPADPDEMIARLRAVLRRPQKMLQPVLRAANLEFDPASRQIWVGLNAISLPRRETCLLETLLRRHGRVVPKAMIEETLYGYDDEVSVNAIEVGIYRLRSQLQASGAALSVRTVRGVGYILEDAPARSIYDGANYRDASVEPSRGKSKRVKSGKISQLPLRVVESAAPTPVSASPTTIT